MSTAQRNLGILAAMGCLLSLFLIAPMDAASQLAVGICLVVALLLLGLVAGYRDDGLSLARVALLIVGAAISMRYLAWRALYTLNIDDPASLAGALLLFAAECYAIATYLGGCLMSVVPMRRPSLDISQLSDAAQQSLPCVDILIPTYDESPSLLETTLRAALQQRYPHDRYSVHLLDDGGTDQRCNSDDETLAATARQRRVTLKALCQRLGVTYHTRARNIGAKAGNLNEALADTHGDLVAVLDADHAPTTGFLARTVPWMIRDPDVFLVQTPHQMINPDPVERNFFRAYNRIPSETDMFYSTIQRGMDFWDASFFCGSAAILRRTHLEEVGGIAGQSVTEDAETSLRLHARGYRSVYLDEPLVAGLAPETFDGMIRQRVRWAQGMIQILRFEKPWSKPGLRWHQRLGYMNAISFWLFPFARITFLLIPLLFLVLGLQIYKASPADILAFTLPHVIGTFSVAYLLHGRTRWPLVSELYEVLQSVFTVRAVIDALIHPESPRFVVTPKGQNLSKTTISPRTGPFYLLLLAMIVGLVGGFERLLHDPMTRELTVFVLLWHLFNSFLVLGALAVIVEQRQTRDVPRISASDRVLLESEQGSMFTAILSDVSMGGCSACLMPEHRDMFGKPVTLQALYVLSPESGHGERIPLEALGDAGPQGLVRCRFSPATESDQQALIRFARGDERRLEALQRRRQRPMSALRSLGMLIGSVGAPLRDHARLVLRRWIGKFFQGKQNYV
jgi:cellulose synthase (UDP-forming)